MKNFQLLFLTCALLSCSQTAAPSKEQKQEQKKEQVSAVIKEDAPKEIPPTPTERRLFVEQAEASSFLHQEDNIPWDRYHPNYIADGDPLSAWNEGAKTNGVGEWVKLPITAQQNVSHLRLRILNGYQKSEALFQANARAKSIQVALLPGRETHTITLEDKMDWQELSFDIQAKEVTAIELKVEEVFDGKKYKDLCLSEVEIFVTSTTKEDPEAEKKKLDSLLAWKKIQLDASEVMKSSGLLPAYQVEESGKTVPPKTDLTSLAGTIFPIEASEYLARAQGKLKWGEEKITKSVKPRNTDIFDSAVGFIPECSGLENNRIEDSESDESQFFLPCWSDGSLLKSVGLVVTDIVDIEKEKCQSSQLYAIWPDAESPIAREVRIDGCVRRVEQETYDAPRSEGGTREEDVEYFNGTSQFAYYDEAGRLRLLEVIGYIEWFDWKQVGSRWVLSGGVRINLDGGVDILKAGREAASQPNKTTGASQPVP